MIFRLIHFTGKNMHYIWRVIIVNGNRYAIPTLCSKTKSIRSYLGRHYRSLIQSMCAIITADNGTQFFIALFSLLLPETRIKFSVYLSNVRVCSVIVVVVTSISMRLNFRPLHKTVCKMIFNWISNVSIAPQHSLSFVWWNKSTQKY